MPRAVLSPRVREVLELLRPGILDRLTVCVAGDGTAVRARLVALGATVVEPAGDEEDLPQIDVLVVDAAAPFAAAGGGLSGLRAALDAGWDAVREVANACWVAEGTPGGKVVLVAPPSGAGEHAAATAAALENLARTLSVEWARRGVRVTAVRPAGPRAGAEVAELVAFLASPAGDYYSGSTFTPAL